MSINKYNPEIIFAKKKDWNRIIEIYNQSVSEYGKTADLEPQTIETRTEWLDQHLSPQYPILLAKIHSKIVGWCSLSPHRPGRKALEKTLEISYYIDYNYRRKGIGTILISSAIEFGMQNQVKNLFAILLDVNKPSIGILKKFGFKKWGHLPNVAEINGKACGQLIYGKHI